MEDDVRLYLAAILVDAVAKAGQTLYVPDTLDV